LKEMCRGQANAIKQLIPSSATFSYYIKGSMAGCTRG
jgi:hypothetical protein